MAAGLGLPPGINDPTTAFADVFVVPVPGFRIDRLTDRAQHPQARHIVLVGIIGTRAHQGPDGGGGGVEDIDLMLFHDLPETARVGVARHALKHQRSRAIGQRTIDNVAVAGDPTHVSCTPVDVAILVVEGELMGHRPIKQIAAGGVQHALGLAGRTGGVQDEQRIFRIHRLRWAIGGNLGRRVLVPDVPAFGHRNGIAGDFDDDDGLDAVDLG